MPGFANKFRNQEIKPQVLAAQVVRVLSEMILDGTLEPGEQLVETELQKHLGISRSPLREAFRDLERRGLVTHVPRRGTFVKEITRKDIKENFPVRAVLEGLAAREAYARMGKKQINRMSKALQGMSRAGEEKDYEGYRKNHQTFHQTFIEASGNQLLTEILQNLRMHRLWYLVSFRYHRKDFQMALDVHQQILDLFSSPETDPAELETVVRSHIDEALEPLFGRDE